MQKQKASLSYSDIAAMVLQLSIREQLKLAEGIFANLRTSLTNPEISEIPNQTTIRAMEQARKGKGKKYTNADQMFEDMEV